MKTTPYTLLFLFVIITMNAKGQATANVSVNIVAPTAISKTPQGIDGPMTIDPNRHFDREKTSGPNGKGEIRRSQDVEVSAASFTLSGSPYFTYSVSVLSNPVMIKNGGKVITIDGFSVDNSVVPSPNPGSLPTQTITVKAKMNLRSKVVSESETETNAMTVVVNYN